MTANEAHRRIVYQLARKAESDGDKARARELDLEVFRLAKQERDER